MATQVRNGKNYFAGGDFASQAQDPVLNFATGGKQVDNGVLRSVLAGYTTGQMSQEEALAKLGGSSYQLDPSKGPQMDMGYGNQPYDPTKMQQNATLNDAKAKLQGMQQKLATPAPNAPAPSSPQQGNPAPQTGGATPTMGADPNAYDPAKAASVQAALDASHNAAVAGASPDTNASSSLLDTLKALTGSTTAPPAPPKMVDELGRVKQEQGFDQAQNDYITKKQNYQKVQDDILAKANDIKSQQGPQVTSAVINGQLTYLDAKTAAALHQAQTDLQNATDILNMKQNTVAEIMQYTQQDYQNASAYHQEQYKNGIDMINAVEGILSTQSSLAKDQFTMKSETQKAAQANLGILQGMIADRPDAFLNVSQDQKTLWNQLELQAGVPLGMTEAYAAARPGVKSVLQWTDKATGIHHIVGIDKQGNMLTDKAIGGGGPDAGISALNESRKAMAFSRMASAVNSVIKTLYPTTQANPINTYASGAQWVNKLGQAYASATDPKNKAKNASDLELIDAAVKINNGGQQITETQVNTLLSGASIQAKAQVEGGKLIGIGALLTDDQRKTIKNLAEETLKGQEKLAKTAVQQVNQRLTKLGFGKSELLDDPLSVATYTNIANDPSTAANAATSESVIGSTANSQSGSYEDYLNAIGQ